MKNLIYLLILLLSLFLISNKNTAQRSINTNRINIKILNGNVSKDSLIIFNGEISPIFYNKKYSESVLVRNNNALIFKLKTPPQLYFLFFKSDSNRYFHRPGFIFLDQHTDSIIINYNNPYLSYSKGAKGNEFRNRFLPFLISASDEKIRAKFQDSIRWEKNQFYDSAIYNYTKKYNNSYVALWLLIDQFSNKGQSIILEKTLNSFSTKIKNSKAWKTLSIEMNKSIIKEGQIFPELTLVDTLQNKSVVKIDKTYQYTLIDFWFSRCKPCLEQIPEIRNLFDQYHASNKLDVINISTDNHNDRLEKLWEKRIKKLRMNWKQYMDENSITASSAFIQEFPTNFLIDKNGYVIKKNISLMDLQELLAKE